MSVCVYKYILTHVCISSRHTDRQTATYLPCISIHIYACIHTYIYTNIHLYIYIRMNTSVYVHVYVCTYVNVHAYIQEIMHIPTLKNVYMGGRLLEGRVRCEEESRVRFELDFPEGTSPPDTPLPCKTRPPRLPGNVEWHHTCVYQYIYV